MKNRKAALKLKTSIPEDKKPAILECLTVELVSSDEEVMDEKEKYFLVHPLPWRSKYYGQLTRALDQKFQDNQSKKGKDQTAPREIGEDSTRPMPLYPERCSWAFKLLD